MMRPLQDPFTGFPACSIFGLVSSGSAASATPVWNFTVAQVSRRALCLDDRGASYAHIRLVSAPSICCPALAICRLTLCYVPLPVCPSVPLSLCPPGLQCDTYTLDDQVIQVDVSDDGTTVAWCGAANETVRRTDDAGHCMLTCSGGWPVRLGDG